MGLRDRPHPLLGPVSGETRPRSAERAIGSYPARVASESILIVEDDERIGSSLVRALRGSGYVPRWASTGAAALDAAREEPAALVLLDLGLPDMDGLEVCRQLVRAEPSTVVVMLTARDEELDVVVGLDAGAVDYVTKPFKLAELLARIRAQLRRVEASAGERSVAGPIRLDRPARRVWLDEVELPLRAKEFDLLARLVADAGHVVTRQDLMADVWDQHWEGSTKTLDFHVAMLRRRLDGDTPRSRITTVRGVGYRLEVP